MPDRVIHKSGQASVGCRVLRLLLPALLCPAAAGLLGPAEARAFEIFGLRLFGSEDAGEDIADPLNYTAMLDVDDGDEELRERLENASALVQDAEEPVSGSLGLLAKARSDREQLVAALYGEARYDGVVEIRIAGRPLDEIPPDAEFDRAGPVPVVVTITPGQVFQLGEVAFRGDAADLSPARFGLVADGSARSGDILKAETLMVRALKDQGRPLAAVTGREVVADSATGRLDVALTVAAGPVAAYGETTVQGTEQVDREFTEYMTGLERGKIYSPQEVDDARERLTGLGVFSSATIKEGTALDAAGQLPIEVQVSERKMRYFGAGATFSNTEGLGLEGYWGHRNLFGRAEKLRVEASVGRLGDVSLGEEGKLDELNYNAAILFEKPGVIGPDSKFFANTKVVYEHPDAYDRFSWRTGVGLSYKLTRRQTVSAEFAVDYSKIEDSFGERRHLLVSLPLQYEFDGRDNRLDPKNGFRMLAFVEPTYDTLNGTTFVKTKGDLSVYRAIDDASRFVLAGRIAAGAIVGADLADVPADRRFYSGGGGSVRGYAYQGIGPKDFMGDPIGGRSFAETSVELRYALNETFGIVPFVDAGSVSDSEFPDFSDFKVGAGIGVRYLTPFGPLRVDVAVPLNPDPDDPDYGIYAGVGQAF